MAKISYIDNDLKYVKAFIKRDYSEIADDIRNNLEDLSFSFESDNKIYGYKITNYYRNHIILIFLLYIFVSWI